MPRYKLTIEYDGTRYAGWQKQDDHPSIQQQIEDALFKFSGVKTDVVGAGRTDSGVHALAQVAHIDLPKDYDPFRIMQGLNFYLFNPNGMPDENSSLNRIAITDVQITTNEFHARFSGKQRHYLYRIINRRARLGLEAMRAWHVVEPLDITSMRAGAKHLLGHHDFSSFRDTKCQAKSPIKTLEKLDIETHGEEIHVLTSARSFLHHQVRIMIGTLVLVGKGKWSAANIKTALEAKDRTQGGPTAPSDGLYLIKVDY